MAATAAATRRYVPSPPPPTLVKARRTTTVTHRAVPARTRTRTRVARRPHLHLPRPGIATRRWSHPITPVTPLAAVGRTAVAVRGLPDSGLIVRITRGRLWIGVLGALLTGIVALNVLNLSFSSASSRAIEQATALQRANSALRAQILEQLSNQRVQAAAAALGLQVPDPGNIAYVSAGPGDVGGAARRLQGGTLTSAMPPAILAAAPAPITAPATSVVPVGGGVQTPTPAPSQAAPPAPAAGAPATQAPAPTHTAVTSGGGSAHTGGGGGISAG